MTKCKVTNLAKNISQTHVNSELKVFITNLGVKNGNDTVLQLVTFVSIGHHPH